MRSKLIDFDWVLIIAACLIVAYASYTEGQSQYPPGAVLTLPEGCTIWAIGGKDAKGNQKEWQVKCAAIEFRTADGKTRIQYLEDGAVEVRANDLHSLRFAASGGLSGGTRLEVSAPVSPVKPVVTPRPFDDDDIIIPAGD